MRFSACAPACILEPAGKHPIARNPPVALEIKGKIRRDIRRAREQLRPGNRPFSRSRPVLLVVVVVRQHPRRQFRWSWSQFSTRSDRCLTILRSSQNTTLERFDR